MIHSPDAAMPRTATFTVSADKGYHFVSGIVLLLIPDYVYSLSVFVDHAIHNEIQFIILSVETCTKNHTDNAFHIVSYQH